jgi:hypothetical protein
MMSFASRLQKIESELVINEPSVIDPEMEARQAAFRDAVNALTQTMSVEHCEFIRNDLESACITSLTRNFLTRAARYVKGDARPLTLLPEVAGVYLHKPERGLLFDRECLACGYDVVECDGCLPHVRFPLCPLCGGEYEPIESGQGKRFTRFYRGWSKANPDKAVDVFVSGTGAISW